MDVAIWWVGSTSLSLGYLLLTESCFHTSPHYAHLIRSSREANPNPKLCHRIYHGSNTVITATVKVNGKCQISACIILPERFFTKFGTSDYVCDLYYQTQFQWNQPNGEHSCCGWNITPSGFSLLVPSTRPKKKLLNRIWCMIGYMMRYLSRKCLSVITFTKFTYLLFLWNNLTCILTQLWLRCHSSR